jgi:hypothetical protein
MRDTARAFFIWIFLTLFPAHELEKLNVSHEFGEKKYSRLSRAGARTYVGKVKERERESSIALSFYSRVREHHLIKKRARVLIYAFLTIFVLLLLLLSLVLLLRPGRLV